MNKDKIRQEARKDVQKKFHQKLSEMSFVGRLLFGKLRIKRSLYLYGNALIEDMDLGNGKCMGWSRDQIQSQKMYGRLYAEEALKI